MESGRRGVGVVSGTTKSELSWGMLLLVLRSGYDIFSKMSICERACGSSSRDIIGFSFVQRTRKKPYINAVKYGFKLQPKVPRNSGVEF